MRRRSVLLAVPAGLLALAGCGDDENNKDKADKADKVDTSKSPTAEPTGKIVAGPLPDITKGREFGQKPTMAKGPGKPSPDLAVKTLVPGRGAAVATGDFLEVNYLGQKWKDGKVFDNSYDRDKPAIFPIGVGKVIPGWDQGLVGKKVSSRVQLAIPPALGYGSEGNPQAGIKGDDTLVFVVDIVGSYNTRSSAQGKEVEQTDKALPVVGVKTDGEPPTIEVPKGKAPTKVVSNYILEGDGPKLKKTDAVMVQYKGVLWDGGKEFDSSYASKQLAQFSLQQVVPGWTEGLDGKKTGSRVLIVVPPDKGYGKEKKDGIPPNSTLVFAVDILAIL
ncbi:FKBP-type peptidyl-prolyl cis-trans isomerase [Streptomyces buecherae]|uniref:peptidylprolyl isomerase n=1 Tax=Streptomyces buecherae TaxID=2763006 RepID=A0A7H8NI09_9ACTN|nr:FKBP-type peptidyl-prolyl cis-trans isomerase [Streptomyces buecherae]QKW53158.1 FKBP-type peptidyl-prolyl cis-trans isomerase [Streptomyces buecherae]